MFLIVVLSLLIILLVCYALGVFYFIYRRSVLKEELKLKYKHVSKICGFFHPSCHLGGGGERVLWEAIKSIQEKYNNILCLVYCDDIPLSNEEIISKVKFAFNIELPANVEFVRLKSCRLLNPGMYKRFTLIGQSMGSILVAIEALWKCVPHIYIDSTGYAFTLPIFKCLALCKTAAYVHYPTISSDMLQLVKNREENFNNNEFIQRSIVLTKMKVHYYKSFAWLYSLVGKSANVVTVNSQWTKFHIEYIWGGKCKLVYPPCDISIFQMDAYKNRHTKRKPWIISVSQFRKEKNHILQLEAFHHYLNSNTNKLDKSYDIQDLRLILIGGCRNIDDCARVDILKLKCAELNITNYVSFKCDVNYAEIIELFKEGLIGLHTMRDEHFGIAIVECMASGLIVVANNSGGPKMDIVDLNKTGFLASTKEEYAEYFEEIFSKPSEHWNGMREEAASKCKRFSSQNFASNILNSLEPLFV